MNNNLRLVILIAVLCGGSVMAQVSRTVPAPNRNITGSSPQHSPGEHPESVAGSIEGFVYWDVQKVSHVPANSCNGLAITVSVGSSSGGPLTAYTPLGTLSNNFKYIGQVREFLAGGKINVYDVCAYAYDKVPVGPSLQVRLTVTQATAFSSGTTPQFEILGPITIINGKCNMLPRIMDPTFSDLGAHWGSCQDMAYNVNFAMLRPGALSAGTPSGTGNVRVIGNSGTSGSPLLKDPAATGTPMLSQAPQQGMLKVATPSTSGEPANQQVTPSLGRGSQVGNKQVRRVAAALNSPRQSHKITNSKVTLHHAEIIAVLEKQSHAAAQEAAVLSSAKRLPGVQVGSGPSQVMRAPGPNGVSASPTSAQTGAVHGNVSPLANSSSLGAVLPQQFNNLAITCSFDPSLRVLTVSGGPGPAIFTPDPKYNFYTVTGCSFGSPGTNSKIYIYFQGTFHEDFQIQEWTDNFIRLSLDQNIKGVDDQNNVTFVVQRNDGKQWTKSGYKFYAARETVQLAHIPQSDFSLNRFRLDNAATQNWKPTYTSPSSSSVVPNLAGLSSEVHWEINEDPDGTLVGGNDLYDFSQLHSTFVLDSTWMEYRDVSCTEDQEVRASKDDWSIDWYGDTGIKVGWRAQFCADKWGTCGRGAGFHTDCFEGLPESNYGLSVSVVGPRGLDPWTGKPVP